MLKERHKSGEDVEEEKLSKEAREIQNKAF